MGRTTASSSWAAALAIGGLIGILVRLLCAGTGLDPDLFHEMCLARAALAMGHIPLRDLFAYTPTVFPVVHHEWGSGMVFYFVMTRNGLAGLMVLRLVLVAVLLATVIRVARMRGTSWPVLLFTLPAALILLAIGFTTVRAQLFTMVFTSLLLLILTVAQKRGWQWLLLILPMHLLWLNMHGAFVIGPAIVLLYAIEESLRKREVNWPLFLLFGACVLLIPVNPYRLAYIPFLWKSLTMSRPMITEWQPLWASNVFLACYLLAMMMLVYCMVITGPRRLVHLVILLIAAALSLRHIRHVPLFAIFWIALVPAYLEQTPMGQMMRQLWMRWGMPLAALYALTGVGCFIAAVPDRPWLARLPATVAEERSGDKVLYPVGPVAYLRSQHLHANIMAPFVLGAYLSWELSPDIKVAADGRYEVAYQTGVVEDVIRFYNAAPEWETILQRYPPEMVLMPRNSPTAQRFAALQAWKPVYQDDVYLLYARR